MTGSPLPPPVESKLDSLLNLGYRGWLVLAYGLITLIAAGMLSIEFRHVDENIETLARERGAVLFRLIELTRDWNARHGGIYAPVTETTQPNPYLKHPRRDLTTQDGQHLTMINPAFMTRQIAELAEQSDGVRYHITSLRPIRPDNAPDAWESRALEAFEAGRQEILELIHEPRGAQHRYMAPLLVKQSCLQCHAGQGYRVGDVRGGISIAMPADKILAVRDAQRRRAQWLFGCGALVLALLTHFVISRSRRHFLHLREISESQDRLIAERTAALSAANRQLLDEVAERKRKEVQISESEARYRSVIETSQNAILIVQAPDFAMIFANEQAAALFGVEMHQIIGQPLISFVAQVDREMVADRLGRRLRGESVSPTSRVRFARPDGSNQRVGDVHVARIEAAPSVAQWVLSIKDVTDRLADERALRIASAVMESAAEGIVVTDAAKHIIEVNPAFTAITGYRPHEVQGKDLRFLGANHQDTEFFRVLWQQLDQDGRWDGEVWNRRPDGSVYVVWMSISAISGDTADSGGRHVATFIDITQRKEVEELLRHRAQSDPLTDLPNRTLFYDRLQVALSQARRYSYEFALLYVDLDHFKEVNDTMGHAAGDQLLVETAHRLLQAVRESDTVARLGGDEFAIILPQIGGLAEVEDVARRVLAALASPFELSNGQAHVSASIGVALFPQHGGDLESIRASADAALYRAKESGRNTYRLSERKSI